MKIKYGVVPILAFLLTNALAVPSRIVDLSTTVVTGTTMSLIWTSPFPGQTYSLTANDVRISTSPISSLNWNAATRLSWLDDMMGFPGTHQTATITGLITNTSYYAAMKVQDSSGSWSTISDLVFTRTISTNPVVWLSWDPSSSGGVSGYFVYMGTNTLLANPSTGGERYDVGNVTWCILQTPIYGMTYYFSATAYGEYGNESDFSNVVRVTVVLDP